MILWHKRHASKLPADTPEAVRRIINERLEALDNHYGKKRRKEQDGGYIFYSPFDVGYRQLWGEIGFDLEKIPPDNVTVIPTEAGEMLFAEYATHYEYTIFVIISREGAPAVILEEIKEESTERDKLLLLINNKCSKVQTAIAAEFEAPADRLKSALVELKEIIDEYINNFLQT